MSSSRRVTRASNAEAHPGKIVLDSITKRRSHEEVATEKAALAAQEKQKQLEHTAKIEHLKATQRQERETQRSIDEMAEVAAKPSKRSRFFILI